MTKELSIEELLNKAKETTKKRLRIENHPNVLRFIKETGLEPGTQVVPTYVIFWFYRNQWNNGGGDAASKAKRTTFFRTFNKNFPTYRKKDQRYYLIKEGVITVNEETLKEAKTYDKKYWSKKPKKKREVHVENP